jgi:hypothetical protein
VLPVVEADTGITVVDAKIIASVKIVAAVVIAGYLLYSKVIFLLLSLFSVFILCASGIEKQMIKELSQLTRKDINVVKEYLISDC